MFYRFTRYYLTLALILLLSGCAGSDANNPVTQNTQQTPEINTSGHISWGLWEFVCDPVSETIDIAPLRSASFNANVLKFLQPPSSPVNLLTVSVQSGSDPLNGFWVVDITLRHPFLSHARFRGFDVRGILMAEGGSIGSHDAGISYHLPGGTRLANADGYTRWWNMQEFTTYGTILGYTEGVRAVPGSYATATLNPYKLFSDDLDEVEPLVSIEPGERATFSTVPGLNTRRYLIHFDIDGGTPPIRFKYAIDASWSLPDPSFDPDYPVEAYDLSANCQEAYMLNVPIFEEKPFYENVTTYGGDAVFLLTIGDWQAWDSGDGARVLEPLEHIWGESPTWLATPLDVLPSAEFVNSNHPTQATFRVSVPNCTPSGLEGQQFLITAESTDPATYMPQIQGDPYAFDWPEAPLAAYMLVDVPISGGGQPPETRFVVGVGDWGTFAGPCYTGSDCYRFCANLAQLDIEGPANDNLIFQWWEGHLDPLPPWDTDALSVQIESLGYTFVRSTEPVFDATGCRLILVNFCGQEGGYCWPFSDAEAQAMVEFVADGGILVFMIESLTWMQVEAFDTLMDQLQVPLSYDGEASPYGDTVGGDLITPHALTADVYDFCYTSAGCYNLESEDCLSLIRTPSLQDMVVLAPIVVD